MLILSNYTICNGFLMFSFWSSKREGPCISSNQFSTGQGRKMSWGNAFPSQTRRPLLQTAGLLSVCPSRMGMLGGQSLLCLVHYSNLSAR